MGRRLGIVSHYRLRQYRLHQYGLQKYFWPSHSRLRITDCRNISGRVNTDCALPIAEIFVAESFPIAH
ncbi:hypothetical protein N9A45_00260 [bacterium]|nr:hypothetical protein [bacterium]